MNSNYDTIISKIVAENVNRQSVLSEEELFALVKAIIKKESNFNPNAVRRTAKEESVGLMQINIKVHKVSRSDMLDPYKNISYGVNYLIYQLNRYGDMKKAISAYNAGSYTNKNRLTYVSPVLIYYAIYRFGGSDTAVIDKKKDEDIIIKLKETKGEMKLGVVVLIFVGLLVLSKLFK